MARYLKELLLVLYLLKGYDYYLDRLDALGLGLATLLFGAMFVLLVLALWMSCLLYTSPSPRDGLLSRMPSSA